MGWVYFQREEAGFAAMFAVFAVDKTTTGDNPAFNRFFLNRRIRRRTNAQVCCSKQFIPLTCKIDRSHENRQLHLQCFQIFLFGFVERQVIEGKEGLFHQQGLPFSQSRNEFVDGNKVTFLGVGNHSQVVCLVRSNQNNRQNPLSFRRSHHQTPRYFSQSTIHLRRLHCFTKFSSAQNTSIQEILVFSHA